MTKVSTFARFSPVVFSSRATGTGGASGGGSGGGGRVGRRGSVRGARDELAPVDDVSSPGGGGGGRTSLVSTGGDIAGALLVLDDDELLEATPIPEQNKRAWRNNGSLPTLDVVPPEPTAVWAGGVIRRVLLWPDDPTPPEMEGLSAS